MKRLLMGVVLLSSAGLANAQESKQDKLWDASLGLGFPHFVSVQGMRHINEKLSLGVSGGYSLIPESTKPCGAKVKMSGVNMEVASRYHLTGSSFFGGLNLGYQHFKTNSVQTTIPGSDYDITDGIKVFYVTPHIGWFKTYASGFSIGTEWGLRLPFANTRYTDRSGPGNYTPDVQDSVDKGMDAMAKKPMPFATLIRIGYAF